MNAKTVILCTDSDSAGKFLRDELSRRIGRESVLGLHIPMDVKI